MFTNHVLLGCRVCVPLFMGYSSLSCVWVVPTGNRGIDETSRRKKRPNEAEIALRCEEPLPSLVPLLPPGLCLDCIVQWHHSRAALQRSHTPSCGIFSTSHLATPCTKGTNTLWCKGGARARKRALRCLISMFVCAYDRITCNDHCLCIMRQWQCHHCVALSTCNVCT